MPLKAVQACKCLCANGTSERSLANVGKMVSISASFTQKFSSTIIAAVMASL